MLRQLHRYYGAGYLHFITQPVISDVHCWGKKQNRDLFLEVMEQVRRRYRFVVMGYVVAGPPLRFLVKVGDDELGGHSFSHARESLTVSNRPGAITAVRTSWATASVKLFPAFVRRHDTPMSLPSLSKCESRGSRSRPQRTNPRNILRNIRGTLALRNQRSLQQQPCRRSTYRLNHFLKTQLCV
jgi:hypothetical protein